MVSGSVDTTTVGVYTLSYNVADDNDNDAVAITRTVNVVDTTIPVITLLGDATVTIEVGDTYTDAGATALDNYDGDITNDIVVSGSVDTTTVGVYTLSYNVADDNDNNAVAITRTVNVESSLSVDDEIIKNLKIYPNPTSDFWKVASLKQIKLIEIFDLAGRKIVSKRPFNLEFKIDANKLSDGVYILVINGKKTYKLIKK